ncbi:MAG: ubiquitin-conjugating enzyme E2, partial [archaeon]|nr:ubiquitin-conjugating enzyme E2 [archaeon]
SSSSSSSSSSSPPPPPASPVSSSSGITPESSSPSVPPPSSEALPSSASTVWASGTGYGTGNTAESQWDQEAYVQNTALKNQLMGLILDIVSGVVARHVAGTNDRLLSLLADSCLVPVVCSYLHNDSMMDMLAFLPFYRSILLAVKSLASHKDLFPLLQSRPGSTVSVADLIGKLDVLAGHIIDGVQAVKALSEGASTGVACTEPGAQNPTSSSSSSASIAASSSNAFSLFGDFDDEPLGVAAEDDTPAASEEDELELAQLIVEVAGILRENSEPPCIAESSSGSQSPEHVYQLALEGLQFDSIDILGQKHQHHFSANLLASPKSSQAKLKRIIRELSSLRSSLPLHPSSSIFVRVDATRPDVLQAMITGPLGTPYGGGCFLFDIYLDATYPNTSPKVNLETTGNGTVRFNPNLYNCGKVCLSLLGTWQGASNESWSPASSTLLQVLVSIQSLIFVSQPYFNEPGYESEVGDKTAELRSDRYSKNIRVQSIRWGMNNQIESPSEGFESVVHTHFLLMGETVLEQISEWLKEAEGDASHKPLQAAAVKFCKTLQTLSSSNSESSPAQPAFKVPESIQQLLATEIALEDLDVDTDFYGY